MTSAAPTYHGQCHCGAVRFSATTALGGMGDCNCSRCRRLGWVMQSVPASDFVLESGGDQLMLYQFNSGTIAHLFCKVCGIESFARGTDGKGQEVVMLNVHCLDDAPRLDIAAITHWDGANW